MPEPSTAYGLFALRSARVALPLESLREVVPCPSELAALPGGGTALLGALDLRGTAIPVLDVGAVLNMEPAAGTPVVVVVAHEGRLLGLVLDAALGIASVAAQDVRPLGQHTGLELALPAVFSHPDNGELVSVLDVAVLTRQPGVLTVLEPVAGQGGPAVGGSRRPLVLVRCGPVGLALDLARVATIEPRTELLESCLTGGSCVGALDFRDLEIAAVDPLAFTGLGELDLETPLQALVLDLDRGFVALLISDIVAVTQAGPGELLALPSVSVSRPELFGGVVRTDDSQIPHLLIDMAALSQDGDLAGLSALNTERQSVSAEDRSADLLRAGQSSHPRYLTYRSGIEMATLLDQIDEIVPLPQDRATVGRPHGDVLGTFLHRQRFIPLVCLAQMMGRPSPEATDRSCVLLVTVDDLQIGLVVCELGELEASTWEEQAQADDRAGQRLVQFGVDEGERLLPAVDLLEVVRHWTATNAPVPAQPRPPAVEQHDTVERAAQLR